jgi:hypothetical protein
MNIFRSDFKKNPRTIGLLLTELMAGIGAALKGATPEEAMPSRRIHRGSTANRIRRFRKHNRLAKESRRINFARARRQS